MPAFNGRTAEITKESSSFFFSPSLFCVGLSHLQKRHRSHNVYYHKTIYQRKAKEWSKLNYPCTLASSRMWRVPSRANLIRLLSSQKLQIGAARRPRLLEKPKCELLLFVLVFSKEDPRLMIILQNRLCPSFGSVSRIL